MPWQVPLNRLDAAQRDFLTKDQGSKSWIKGPPGTGKSVLLVHYLIKALKLKPTARACIVLYTHSLIDQYKEAVAELKGRLVIQTYFQFQKSAEKFDFILVDEVQDLPENVLVSAAQRSKELLIAGDFGQSIYEYRITETQINNIMGVQPYSLNTIHRLTGRLVGVVKHLFPEKNLQSSEVSRTASVDILVGNASALEEEVKYVWQQAKKSAVPDEPSAILLPSHAHVKIFVDEVRRQANMGVWQVKNNNFGKPDYDALTGEMMTEGLPMMYVGSTYGNLHAARMGAKVIVMTYHSSKGLDFEHVFLPLLDSETTIWFGEQMEKTLLFVAMTRTRLNLTITYTGQPHHLIAHLPEHLVTKASLPSRSASVSVTNEDTLNPETFVF